MKLLVLSDSHGNFDNPYNICQREHPDAIIHLGDGRREADDLAAVFDKPVYAVAGNCDYTSALPYFRMIELEGKRIFLCHGHTYNVKSGIEYALDAARENECDILLFGHTHRQFCNIVRNIWVMNPGSCRYHEEYGIIRLENNEIICYNTSDFSNRANN